MLWEFGGRSHSSLVDDFLYSRHLSPFDNVKVTYVEINFWSLGCWRVGQIKSVLSPGVKYCSVLWRKINMQISQVMTSQPNFDQVYDEKRYLGQIVSEMFDSLQ